MKIKNGEFAEPGREVSQYLFRQSTTHVSGGAALQPIQWFQRIDPRGTHRYAECRRSGSSIPVFPVPQLVAPGEVRTLPALPSFLYFPTEEELSGGGVVATWNEHPAMVTGVLAREQGALVPSRQVSSAKSWLSYGGAHRCAKILPAQAKPPQPMISPVEASARYLMHLRDAWNADHVEHIGTSFFKAVCQRDCEGIVGKHKNGPYSTTPNLWVKVLNPDYTQKRGRREMFDKFRERATAAPNNVQL